MALLYSDIGQEAVERAALDLFFSRADFVLEALLLRVELGLQLGDGLTFQ